MLVLYLLKFVFSKMATKIDEIFTVDLTVCSKCQIDSEDFVKFCGLRRKHELYQNWSDLLGEQFLVTECFFNLFLEVSQNN